MYIIVALIALIVIGAIVAIYVAVEIWTRRSANDLDADYDE
jgi:hypothetical protein